MTGSNVPMRDTVADDVNPAIGGYNASGFGVRVYTKEITKHLDTASRITNFDPANVVTAPGTSAQVIIPLMSESVATDAAKLT